MNHPLLRASPIPAWPSYTGTSFFAGMSARRRIAVYVDPSLGAPAMQNAHELLADADRVADANDAIFGTPGAPVSVILFALGDRTDGTGGADHGACNFTEGGAIEVCVAFGNGGRVSALFEAELSECSMGGNLCGVSTGEALSRWCSAVVGNNALADFATAPSWVEKGMPDFVNVTDPTDQNPVSTGCGMVFLSWLQSLGHPLRTIAPAMVKLGTSGTLAQLYSALAGRPAAGALPAFMAAVKALPRIDTDDPFGAGGTVRRRKPASKPASKAAAGTKPAARKAASRTVNRPRTTSRR